MISYLIEVPRTKSQLLALNQAARILLAALLPHQRPPDPLINLLSGFAVGPDLLAGVQKNLDLFQVQFPRFVHGDGQSSTDHLASGSPCIGIPPPFQAPLASHNRIRLLIDLPDDQP